MTLPCRDDFRFLNPLRVRWSEVDQQRVVFNAHYLTYFDIAFTDYWRALAIPYDISLPALGGEPFVRKATVEFHASARLDDQLEVGLRCARIGNSSMGFVGGIFCEDRLLISSELVYVYADPHAQVPVPVPAALREAMLGYEAWEPMTRVEIGTWAALGAEVASVRDEHGAHPLVAGSDGQDATALHALLRNRLGLAIGCGRLLPASAGAGPARIDRLGVRRVLRGSHFGRALLRALMQAGSERGDREVEVQAPRSSRGFFERLGFEPSGEPFEREGLVLTALRHPLPTAS